MVIQHSFINLFFLWRVSTIFTFRFHNIFYFSLLVANFYFKIPSAPPKKSNGSPLTLIAVPTSFTLTFNSTYEIHPEKCRQVHVLSMSGSSMEMELWTCTWSRWTLTDCWYTMYKWPKIYTVRDSKHSGRAVLSQSYNAQLLLSWLNKLGKPLLGKKSNMSLIYAATNTCVDANVNLETTSQTKYSSITKSRQK